MPRTLLLLYCITIAMLPAFAQDAHYWSNNYGPGVLLTPGSVIASNRDSGVLFYNPALLSLSNKNRIAISTISANIYQLDATRIKNGAGTGRDLHNNSVRIVPQMLSGSISLGKKAPVVIAYALINSPGFRFQASQRRDDKINALNDEYSPGDEYFVGDYVLENRVNETSALLSTGFRLTPRLSAGFSVEGQLRQQHYNVISNTRALANADIDSLTSLPLISSSAYYLATYVHAGVRFKAGLAYDAGRHHLGWTISSPLLHVWGSGTIVTDYTVSNMYLDVLKDFYSYLANSRQESLKTNFKMPLSTALGYAYDFRRGQLYVAAEYFHRVKEYNVITPRNDAFIRPDTGSNSSLTRDFVRLHDARKAILNVAVGVSYNIRPSVTGYLSVRTDMSYADKDQFKDQTGYEPYTAYWNLVHWTLGANFKQKKFNFRTGFLCSYGVTNHFPQDVNFDHPNENNLLQGDPTDVRARRFSVGFMLAYIHNL